MARDWDDRDDDDGRRGWDDNRSFDARGEQGGRRGRAGDFPSQYSGMGGSRTDNFGQHQFESGDRNYGGGSRMSGWRPDWDPQDQDRYDHSRGRWEALGEGDGGRRHDHDDAYLSWRERQMQALDREYDEFRRHRQERFHQEFEDWRKSRGGAGSAAASYSGSQTGGTGEQSERGSATQRPAGGDSK